MPDLLEILRVHNAEHFDPWPGCIHCPVMAPVLWTEFDAEP